MPSTSPTMRRLATGVAAVTVLSLGSVLGASAAHATQAPAPTITSVDPNTATTAGGVAVTIDGTNLGSSANVNFFDTADGTQYSATPTSDSGTEIVVDAPAVTETGAYTIGVTTTAGDSADTSADHFTYTAATPTVTGIDPTTGANTGGTSVTVTGSGFTTASTVRFGTVAGTVTAVTTPEQLEVTSPATSVTGAVDVTVTNGSVTSATSPGDTFTYTQAPAASIVAVEGKNTNLYVSAAGAGFINYGGVLKGAPAVVSTSARNYYFVRGNNNDLYVRTDKTAFTHLRPSKALVCATAPGASVDGNDYVVGCVGVNGVLYTLSGTFPSTGNPVAAAVSNAGPGFNNDSTSVKGAVEGTNDGLELTVTGPVYSAADSVGNLAGNTYLFTGQSSFVALGGMCSYAPTLVDTSAQNSYYQVCHAPAFTTSSDASSTASAETFVYKTVFTGSPSMATTTTIDLHGSAMLSPAAVGGASAIVVYVTGTNSSLYTATVSDGSPSTATAFTSYPAPAVAVSGPGASIGNPPVTTPNVRERLSHRSS